MNNKKFRRFAALMLAGAMVIGSSAMVFADDTSISSDGSAKYEGDMVENDAMVLTLPTESNLQDAYNYTADPNGLLAATSNKGLGASVTVADNEGVLFLTEANNYGPSSKKIEVTSESAVDVDVTVKAQVKDTYDGLAKFNADKTKFTEDNKEKELYIAVVNCTDADATKHTSDAIKGMTANDAASITYTVKGVSANYELKYDDSGETPVYKYEKKGTLETAFNKAAFQLTGAINTNAEWTGVAEKGLPNITVTWSYAKHVDSYLSATKISATSRSLTLSMPADVTLKNITFTAGGAVVPANAYTITENTITFIQTFATNQKGKSFDLNFSNDKKETITVE